MQLVKAFKTEALIEGMTKTVLISIETDHDDVDFSYWDESLAKETQASIDKGLTQCVYVKVTARFADLEHFKGQDSLGQVFLRSMPKSSLKDLKQTVSQHGMVKTAIDDLISNVLTGVSQIESFLGKVA